MLRVMKEKKLYKFGVAFIAVFLFCFMLFIFGPSEIFFTNAAEFEFVYGDFAYLVIGISLVFTMALSLLLMFMPMVVYKIIVSLFFGFSVAGYVQVMFINSGLDLLGMNPEGYQVAAGQAIVNILIWLAIIALMLYLAFSDMETWKLMVSFGSEILICIQAVAWCTLVFSAGADAYVREDGGQYILSGEEQYSVSAKDNIIVFIMDYFSNEYLNPMLEEDPDLLDCMKDFTYYNNTDCVYFGTYPSLIHILSGQEPEPQTAINNWCYNLWQSEEVQGFYKELREQDYVSNVYTPEKSMLCGMNSLEVMKGTFSNIVKDGHNQVVNYELLVKTMIKMSGYRMFPYILKPYVYTDYSEYADIVSQKTNKITHTNSAFYAGLLENGLTANRESNYYVVQHLEGTHAFTTASDGSYKADATREETIKGCLVILEEYMNQLKKLGVYDDATIIVTSDHGGPRDSQVIFFMKEPGEEHNEIQVNKAPISLCEYPATIANAAGGDSQKYGMTVKDIPEDQLRERTVWVRLMVPNLPMVNKYSGNGTGADNAYCGFTYSGDAQALYETYDDGADIVIPEIEAFY